MGHQIDTQQILFLQHEVQSARVAYERLVAVAKRMEELVENHPQKEAIYRDAGDLMVLVPEILDELRAHFATLALVADTWDGREVRYHVPDTKKKQMEEVFRKKASFLANAARLAKVAASGLPGGGDDPSRSDFPNSTDSDNFGADTFNSGGSTKQERAKKPGNDSIHEVLDPDDRAKAQSDGRDQKDWTGVVPMYNYPRVPDYVRR